MNMPDSLESTLLLVSLFVPGFLSIKVYDLIVPPRGRDFSRSALDAIAYGAINFGLVGWWLLPAGSADGIPFGSFELWWRLFVVFVAAPAIWPIVLIQARRVGPLAKRLRRVEPSPWDMIFSRQPAVWILVHMKDGRKFCGKYAKNSYATVYPDSHEIFLERQHVVSTQGGIGEKVDRTGGVLVCGEEIVALEFWKEERDDG